MVLGPNSKYNQQLQKHFSISAEQHFKMTDHFSLNFRASSDISIWLKTPENVTFYQSKIYVQSVGVGASIKKAF